MTDNYEIMKVEDKIDVYLSNRLDEGTVSSLIKKLLKKGKKYLLDTLDNILSMAIRELSREIQYKLSIMNTNTSKSGDIRRELTKLNREANFYKSRYLEILQQLEEYATENWDNYTLKTHKELEDK